MEAIELVNSFEPIGEDELISRAAKYALNDDNTAVVEELKEYILFKLDDELYAFEAVAVSEVVKLTEHSKLPRMDPVIKGLVNIRGDIILLADIKLCLHLNKNSGNNQTKVLVVEHNGIKTGFRVDSIIGFETFDTGNLQSSAGMLNKTNISMVQGFYQLNNKPVILLIKERILKDIENRMHQ